MILAHFFEACPLVHLQWASPLLAIWKMDVYLGVNLYSAHSLFMQMLEVILEAVKFF